MPKRIILIAITVYSWIYKIQNGFSYLRDKIRKVITKVLKLISKFTDQV